ncbi:MAG: pyridoxal phosphate-dependent aminotransferase [Candidatus Lokiarchaeota archaeon]|nr:pyridoxal phosphate-dependent aminotransferase [Candidatus Lokiarchaeota archaeon]
MTEKNTTFNFDQVIDRANSTSAKWDKKVLEKGFGDPDLLPLWVADMDFKAPKPIIERLVKTAEYGIFGYSIIPPSFYEAVLSWFKRRYGWEIDKKWLSQTPGVIPALDVAVNAFCNPGDKVIVQNPIYYPFYRVIENNGCRILLNPLKFSNSHYTMDFEDLEKKVKDPRAKMIILCNPHNPIGRVWTKEELKQLGNICITNEILVVSDEIHCDLIFPGYKHTNFAIVNDEFAQNSITCTSTSKTFNLAGLKISNIVIPNQKIRQTFVNTQANLGVGGANLFAVAAMEAAYSHEICENWLEALLQYLKGNLDFLKTFIKENIPQIKVIEPEGTYLIWLDCRELGLDHKELEKFMRGKAKLALDEGYIFGQGGEGFERINIACPKSILEDALNRIKEAMSNMKN